MSGADLSLVAVKAIRASIKEGADELAAERRVLVEAVKGLAESFGKVGSLAGHNGDVGPQGPQGEPGRDGLDGKDGRDGNDAKGERGLPGRDGREGPAGPQGAQGHRGPDGKPGIRWRGEYVEGTEYSKGDLVARRNALWISRKDKVFTEPSTQANSWDAFIPDLSRGAQRIAGYGVVQGQGAAGTSVSLKVNGTANGSQSILNLKNGSNVTITDDGVGGITIASSGGGGGISWTRVTKTHANTPYTIPAASTLVVADTSGGVLTVNLPTTPADGDLVAVKRSTTDTNALTLGHNGKNIEGAAADITALSGSLYCYEFQYDSAAGSWWIV